MSCQACADPQSGLLIDGCRNCALRDIARGPEFFNSMRHGRLTDGYKAAVRALGDVAAVHEEVKAVSKTLFMGSVRA